MQGVGKSWTRGRRRLQGRARHARARQARLVFAAQRSLLYKELREQGQRGGRGVPEAEAFGGGLGVWPLEAIQSALKRLDAEVRERFAEGGEWDALLAPQRPSEVGSQTSTPTVEAPEQTGGLKISSGWYGNKVTRGVDMAELPTRISVEDVPWVALPSVRGETVELIPLLPEEMKEYYAEADNWVTRNRGDLTLGRSKDQVDPEAVTDLYLAAWRGGTLSFRSVKQIATDDKGDLLLNGHFKVPKGDGRFRLITDLRTANRHFPPPADPSLPNPDALVRWMRWAGQYAKDRFGPGRGIKIFKRDIDNFYHRLAVPEWLVSHQAVRVLSDQEIQDLQQKGVTDVNKDNRVACVSTLAMGNSHSVTLAQSVMRELVRKALLRTAPWVSQEIRIFVYIDDVSVIGNSKAGSLFIEAFEKEILKAGLVLKTEKNVDGEDEAEIMGVQVNTRTWEVGVSPHRCREVWQITAELLQQPKVSARQVMNVVGTYTWLFLARRCLLSTFFFVYQWEHADVRLDLPRSLTREARRELWRAAVLLPMAYTDARACPVGTAVSDACMYGGGLAWSDTVCSRVEESSYDRAPVGAPGQSPPVLVRPPTVGEGRFYRWGWKTDAWEADITRRELSALHTGAVRGARTVAAGSRPIVVRLHCDNMGALGLSLKGRSSNVVLNRDLRRHAAYQLSFGLYLERYYVPSESNIADKPSRGAFGWAGVWACS